MDRLEGMAIVLAVAEAGSLSAAARNGGFQFRPIGACRGSAYVTGRPTGPIGGMQTGEHS